VFGDLMADIDSIRLADGMRIDEETLFALLNAVRVHESSTSRQGAVHGCALAKASKILTFVEDVGRHNAVDAIAGGCGSRASTAATRSSTRPGASPPRW
jgi:FdhD protein